MLNEQTLKSAVSSYVGTIRVPEFDAAAIRGRTVLPLQTTARRNPLRALALGLILVPCAAIAYTVIPDSVKQDTLVQLHAMGIPVDRMVFHSGGFITLQQARREASFAMVLPAGLPTDAVLKSVTTAVPDVFTFEYETPRGPVYFELHKASHKTYLEPIFVAGDSASPEAKVHLEKFAAQVWHVGDQDFIVATHALTGSQLARIKAAMGAVNAPAPPPARN